MVVETVFLIAQSQSSVPLYTCLLPLSEPVEFCAWLDEELHLHLLELSHSEHELTSNNLVTERLSYLRDTEWQLHTASLLHVQIVHEDTLRSLRTKINLHRAVGCRTHLCAEHQVKLTDISPVLRSAHWVNYLIIKDYLLELSQIVVIHGFRISCVERLLLVEVLLHSRTCLSELLFVESVAESLSRLLHLFLYLGVVLSHLVLYQHIGSVSLLRVAVVYQRVVERVNVARSLPCRWVHEY